MRIPKILRLGSVLVLLALPGSLLASSHMDAPLITLDPAANTTDVYAWKGRDANTDVLYVALGVYPFEEPGIGPNKYNFDDNVLYQIHVATRGDVPRGIATTSYQFQFTTNFKNVNTILQSYLGVVQNVGDDAQNLLQTYRVTKVDRGTGRRSLLATGMVPPNNQGRATPFYNQGDNGDNPAKDGVSMASALDRYTSQSIVSVAAENGGNYRFFAGQREDGFYGDILSVFDLLQLRNPGRDSQGGFNIHMIVASIPVSELGGSNQVVGVYATTSRPKVTVLNDNSPNSPILQGPFVQVGRQGNPLFNELFVAIKDKDLYSRTSPVTDDSLFFKYASNPEPAALINAIVLNGALPQSAITARSDIVGIFIPDLIKVDLSTPPVRLAGGGANNPDDTGFSRLSIFGGDTLMSTLTGGAVPGGWPNGRRFGDDVVDIGVTALISDLRVSPPIVRGPAGDNVNGNDSGYNRVFPFAGTPHNGRNHGHHGSSSDPASGFDEHQ
jgi:Domain of unknown function (DUF4331)